MAWRDIIHLKPEAVRLRTEERLSLGKIAQILGVSKGTASLWLRDYPLAEGVVSGRHRDAIKERRAESPYAAIIAARHLTPQQIGKISEAAVLFRLTIYGLTVYGSPFDGDKADWVVSVPTHDRLLRLQVRSARSSNGMTPHFNLYSVVGWGEKAKSRRFDERDFDFFVAYDYRTDTAYVYSVGELVGNQFTLRVSEKNAERWDKLFEPL